jgi:hypothetical protein
MPIIERDPWREQYFEGVACPEDVVIPTDDEHAYVLFPRHRWVYNKLLVCDTQGIPAAPHGVPPTAYPVFSKPIYNLHGMGIGGRIIESEEALNGQPMAGYMWMECLDGEHVSTDVVLVDGEPCWWRHTTGRSLGEGVFDYWTIDAEGRPELERDCGDWLRRNLKAYTGAANLETIDGRIIEAHLRFADQWPDLYGHGWLEAIVRLYAEGTWDYADLERRDGYSVVLFGAHGVPYRMPEVAVVDEIRARPGVTSVQITFRADLAPELHAMPPGGFRLAIVNCVDLDVGLRAREDLALVMWSAQRLGRRRRRPHARGGA